MSTLTILIADPDEEQRLRLKAAFTDVVFPGRKDIKIDETHDGRAAITMVGLDRPKLVLADVNLERLDGLLLTQTIKRSPISKSTKVIVLSDRIFDNAAQPYQLHAKNAKADDFLVKPVDSLALKISVSSLLPREVETPESGIILTGLRR